MTFPDGKPLTGGSIEFANDAPLEEQVNARGDIQPDGTFRLSTFQENDGAVAGTHRIVVSPPMAPPSNMSGPPPKPVIDPRFQKYETSGLTFTVQPDKKNFCQITVERP